MDCDYDPLAFHSITSLGVEGAYWNDAFDLSGRDQAATWLADWRDWECVTVGGVPMSYDKGSLSSFGWGNGGSIGEGFLRDAVESRTLDSLAPTVHIAMSDLTSAEAEAFAPGKMLVLHGVERCPRCAARGFDTCVVPVASSMRRCARCQADGPSVKCFSASKYRGILWPSGIDARMMK